MNYNSDNSSTRTENNLVENLTKKNAQGIAEMRTDALPVMVPIQEKDWDTMVSLLQSAVDFQPKVYELMRTLLTVIYRFCKKELRQYQCRELTAETSKQEVHDFGFSVVHSSGWPSTGQSVERWKQTRH